MLAIGMLVGVFIGVVGMALSTVAGRADLCARCQQKQREAQQ